MKLLDIQSSVRKEGSISRQLSNHFVSALRASQPQIHYKKRDVGTQPPAHPTERWTQANYSPPQARSPELNAALLESERLIEELFWANYLVLGVPMYNFSVPSTLKAYLDNIIRINRTFSFDPANRTFQGLAIGKKALVITPSAGNFVAGTAYGHLNFCDTYLRSVLSFIGISDISVIPVPDQFMGDGERDVSLASAKTQLLEIAAEWATHCADDE